MSEQSNDKVEAEAAGEGAHPIAWQHLGGSPTTTPVTPSEFRNIMASRKENPAVYRPVATALSVQPGQAATVQSPASVAELARALKNDVDLIFYHVYNQIEFFPSYGLQKSSEATLLDGIGNAWDQASLLVDLLRAAGHTANFVFGDVEMTTAEISAWLGTDDSDPAYASNILYWGGIPYSSGSGTVTFSHIWVKIEMGGVDYILDPSIKTYSSNAGIDLGGAMDYDKSALRAAADDGATHGTDDLWIKDFNVDGLNAELSSYASNLIDWIKTNQPAATVDDIIGGKKILEITSPVRQTSHPHETGTPVDWTSIPNTYRTTIQFQYAGINQTFYADYLYGRRTTIFFNGSRQPVLRIDGTVVATGSAQSIGSTSSAYITVIHPSPLYYQSFNVSIAAPLSTGASYYLLGTTIGATRKGMVDHHNELVDKAMASGADELSDELLGEQLSVGWHTLNAELTAISDMASRLSDCIVMPSHSVGLHWRNTAPIYNTVHFDVPGGPAAVVSKIPYNEDRRIRAAQVISMFSNTLEELTINQVYSSEIGASAARILKLANAEAANKIYLATQDNWSTVSANLTNYTHFSPSTIYSSFISNGGVALIPEIAGQDIGNGLHADGYRAFMPGGSVYGYINVYKGGCGPWGWGGKCKCKDCEEEASDPVGLLTGAFKYRQTDLTVGSSSYPYQLSFETEYSSAERYKEGALGLGWSHNWELGAVKVSEPFRGVGSSPIEAVASLVSVFVAMDLYVPDFDSPDFDSLNLMAGSLTSSWWVEQLTFNVVSALTDSGSVEFVKLPDGSYHSCEGDGWSVAEDAGEYTVTSPQKVDYVYNTDGDLETISFPYGVTISLTYSSGKLTAIENGMGRAFSLSYTGDRLSSISDGNGRSVGYAYDLNERLEAITDPLENDTTFSYDAAGLMKSYFMPQNPIVPMVVNTYDTLGRVASQLDMYGRVIVRVESSKVTVSGTVTADDVATITARVAGLVKGQKSVSYTVQAGDTLADIATGLKNAINADATLSGVGVSASSTGAVISFASETAATYGLSTSIKATITLTPTATTGDILTVTVFNSGLSGGQKSLNYIAQIGDTAHSVAQGLKDAINNDSSLTSVGVTAVDLNGPEKGRFIISSTSFSSTTYSSTSSTNATESIFFDSHASFYFAGWRTEFENALGYRKVSLHDRFGNVIKTIDELGNETVLVYDGLSRLVEKIMPEGNSTLWTHDSKNNILTKTDKPKPGPSLDDIEESFTWHAAFNQVVTAEDGNGNVTSYFYDTATGNLIGVQRPEVGGQTPTISYQYNARGQVLSQIDETGIQTQFYYDSLYEDLLQIHVNTNWKATIGGVASVSDVLTITVTDAAISGGSKAKSYTVLPADDLEAIANGLADVINADTELKSLFIMAKASGKEISLSTAPGNTTTFSTSTTSGATVTNTLNEGLDLSNILGYNVWGDVNSLGDARGNATSFVFDEKRRLTQSESASPFAFITNHTYDKNGNRLTVEHQTGDLANPWQIYTTAYNLANQPAALTDPDNNTTTSVYTELQQLWKVTEGDNKTTEYRYDERAKLAMVKDSALVVVQSRSYTDNGKISSIEDANGNVISFTQDRFDRISKTIFPDDTFEQNTTYDANGNVLNTLTRAGKIVSFEFDQLNRLVEKSPEGMPIVSFEYDLSGRRIKVGTPVVTGDPASGQWRFQYDSAGRLVAEVAPDEKNIGYELDQNGNIIKIEYPDSWYVQRFYDELNRLTDIKLNGDNNSVAHFDYDNLSRRTALEFNNGTQIIYGHERNNDMSAIEIAFNSSSLKFSWGFNSNRKVIDRYVSDARHLWFPTRAKTIPYDPANALNQYQEINDVACSYDDSGNLTDDGVWAFAFDTENQLISATEGSVTVSYIYGPMHQQIQKNNNGTKTRYVYAGWNRLADYSGNDDALQNRYVYGSGIDEPLLRVSAEGEITYMYADHLGSIVALADHSGIVTNRYNYSPYGESDTMDGTTFGFTGQRYDVETGLYYYKNRYYSPTFGRFLQADPTGLNANMDCGCGCESEGSCPDTSNQLNLYSYVNNDPLNWVDPSGFVIIERPYANWGGDDWTNHRRESEISNFPWKRGQKGFKRPRDPRDNCYYKHDVCLHNCARIKCPAARRRCRNNCNRDLAACLRWVFDTYGHIGRPTTTLEAELFDRYDSGEGDYRPDLKYYNPNYDPGVQITPRPL